MAMTREEEERQRISGAMENVEKWKERFGGISGGVRVSYSNGPTFTSTIGDPVIAKRVIDATPMRDPVKPLMIVPVPVSDLIDAPAPAPKSRRARHWSIAWLFNLISTED